MVSRYPSVDVPHDTPGSPPWQLWEDAYRFRIIASDGARPVFDDSSRRPVKGSQFHFLSAHRLPLLACSLLTASALPAELLLDVLPVLAIFSSGPKRKFLSVQALFAIGGLRAVQAATLFPEFSSWNPGNPSGCREEEECTCPCRVSLQLANSQISPKPKPCATNNE